jgi:hypothetical protein
VRRGWMYRHSHSQVGAFLAAAYQARAARDGLRFDAAASCLLLIGKTPCRGGYAPESGANSDRLLLLHQDRLPPEFERALFIASDSLPRARSRSVRSGIGAHSLGAVHTGSTCRTIASCTRLALAQPLENSSSECSERLCTRSDARGMPRSLALKGFASENGIPERSPVPSVCTDGVGRQCLGNGTGLGAIGCGAPSVGQCGSHVCCAGKAARCSSPV